MIPLHKPFIPSWDKIGPALQKVFESGQISQGAQVDEFERRFGEFVGKPSTLAVSSCTAALHLALELAEVRGGEVVSTPMTAEPTNLAVHYAGAQVVWADVDPRTGNVTAETVKAAVRWARDVRAIMVVHYGGVPVDASVLEVAKQHNILVIEDCAHSLGSVQTGWGEYQAWSFQAIKHLTLAGEGGALCVPPKEVERARRLRWFGIDRKVDRSMVDVTEVGWKYNLTNVQATFGLVALDALSDSLLVRRSNSMFFDSTLQGISGVTSVMSGGNPLLFYTILCDRRDEVAARLLNGGVECGQVHRRNDEHSIFAYARRVLPGLDEYYSKMLHIPCGWWVTKIGRDLISAILGGC